MKRGAEGETQIINALVPPDEVELDVPRTCPVLREGILDRLINSTFHVDMEGKSNRPHKRLG
ncbi:MAG: hypothetical protein ACOX8V_06655 [Thermoleophilia bacterium]